MADIGAGPSEVSQALGEFTRDYLVHLNRALDLRGRGSFVHHGELTEIVWLFHAKDGVITFYLPAPTDHPVERGVSGFDYTDYTVDEIAQSLSLHRLKVATPREGDPVSGIDLIPPDSRLVPGLTAPFIQDDVRKLAASRDIGHLQGMTVFPVMDVTPDGRVAGILPARFKVWSPVFRFPKIGIRRLFHWTHVDIWWHPDRLQLSSALAASTAERDAFALSIFLGDQCLPGPDVAQNDTSDTAAGIVEGAIAELLQLLHEHGNEEERIHQWLKDPRRHVFLDPHAVEVRSKVPFGDKESDFVAKRSDGTYVLVEIERATCRVFRKGNNEPTAEFNHACQQVKDWQRYIRDNVHTVREEQRMPGIYEPAGMVIVGRSSDIDSVEAVTRWKDMKARGEPQLLTYDELIDRARALLLALRKACQMKA